jgi:hypothetical protein
MTAEDALVLAPGPSFGDYLLEDLRACPAVKYGCGHVSDVLELDHYALGDFYAHRHHIPTQQHTKLHVTSSVMEDATAAGSLDVGRFELIDADTIFSGSAGNMAFSLAVAGGHKRVFVLGFDGFCDSGGVYRRRVHSLALTAAEPLFPERWGTTELNADDMRQIYVCNHLKQRHAQIYKLDLHGILPLPIADESRLQDLWHLDRHGQLLILIVPFLWLNMGLDMVCFWQEHQPHRPIVVVTFGPKPVYARYDVLFRTEPPSDHETIGFNRVDTITFWNI